MTTHDRLFYIILTTTLSQYISPTTHVKPKRCAVVLLATQQRHSDLVSCSVLCYFTLFFHSFSLKDMLVITY